MMDPVVELREVRKAYGRRAVLRGVSLAVARGEILGLLGPNGSGKTTTLRIAAGCLAADAGTVRVCGDPMGPGRSRARENLGFLPERPPLYDALTVLEYLEFVAAAKRVPAARRRSAVDDALEAFDLGEVRRKTIGRLSKGYRQRVGLAQAVLGGPALLLLDEATNGLDPLQIMEARRLIHAAGSGRAVIFSTHILQEAAALCSRVVFLQAGELVACDAPGDAGDADVQVLHVAIGGVSVDRGVSLLAGVPGVRDARCVEGGEAGAVTIRCTAMPGEDIRDRVARAVLAGATLLELKPHQPTLEERFSACFSDARQAQERDS